MEREEAVRAVILTGAGRGFCAGQDLGSVNLDGLHLGELVRKVYNPIVRRIRAVEKPIICAVNGVAAGAGANIALACDIVIASEQATFVQSFSKIGLIPDSGGTVFLPRLLGFGRASALTLLGEKLTGRQAEEVGLIYKSAPADKVMEEANQIAERLSELPPVGLALTKRALNRTVFPDLDEHLESEAELQEQCGLTEDFREGIQAFLQKRTPTFKGR
jgi:2-(1,2-epoxy-1,2-dihydrophenyl)acetyl-CoA isomerase